MGVKGTLDFRQRIKELHVGSFFLVLCSFYTASYGNTGSRGGGGMLIVAIGNPYPLALSDSPEDYIIWLKWGFVVQFSQIAWTGKYKIDHLRQ